MLEYTWNVARPLGHLRRILYDVQNETDITFGFCCRFDDSTAELYLRGPQCSTWRPFPPSVHAASLRGEQIYRQKPDQWNERILHQPLLHWMQLQCTYIDDNTIAVFDTHAWCNNVSTMFLWESNLNTFFVDKLAITFSVCPHRSPLPPSFRFHHSDAGRVETTLLF
jgi:hypothetical protein